MAIGHSACSRCRELLLPIPPDRRDQGRRQNVLMQHARTLTRRMESHLRQTVWSARRLARKLARVAVGSGPAVEPQLREALV